MLDQMEAEDRYKPVSVKLAEDLVDKIHRGVYADKLPPVQALAAEYQVNFKTANRAVALLAKKRVLDSRPGWGTHVAAGGREIAARLRKKARSETLVLFFVPAGGHVYGELYARTTALLNRSHYLPVIISDGDQEAMLAQVKELRPTALVINRGWDRFPYDQLDAVAASGVRIVFQQQAEYEPSFPADYVLSDTMYGAYLATKHLLDRGHKRILFLTYRLSPVPPPMLGRHTTQFQMLQGYRMALAEAGLEAEEIVRQETLDMEAGNDPEFKRLLMGPRRATAIFADGDRFILSHFGTIRKLGLKVPDDLALVGYYDTPLCQYCEVPLSSVSINVAELARHTVERVRAEDGQHARMAVKPELIVRESCGAAGYANAKSV